MAVDLDPIRFGEELRKVMTRYITTAASVAPSRAPRLARALRERLAREMLVEGPFVESLPDFVKGGTIRELVADGRLDAGWAALENHPEGARLFDLPLHQHQTAAIGRGDNYIVATGTGSGKTEAFLLPLIDDLMRASDLDRGGIRTILVYPLNGARPRPDAPYRPPVVPRSGQPGNHARSLHRPSTLQRIATGRGSEARRLTHL